MSYNTISMIIRIILLIVAIAVIGALVKDLTAAPLLNNPIYLSNNTIISHDSIIAMMQK